VVGIGRFLEHARTSRAVIIDGDEGLIVLDPDQATLEHYQRAAVESAARFAGLAGLAILPAETRDGTRIALWGNIEFPGEVVPCRERGADGIGLYRTEFLYLGTERPPTEDEQLAAYEAVIRSMLGRPVTIRTLDLGADKLVVYQGNGIIARNPFLGLRSLRLSLRDPELFRTQLRAILRASTLGDVRLMFPLVSTLAEFRRARAMVNEVAAELRAEGLAVRSDLPVGAMIEVPAAALMADQLAKEVNFFSIGTNDLIQYALAVDRTDEAVADLYSASDPAVLRLITMVIAAADRHGVEVDVCGSMGGEPLYTPLLLGMGLRRLSMPPHQLPEIKRVIRAIDLEQARAVSAEALSLDTADAVTELLRAALRRLVPDAPLPAS
jgi:phosphotransferase system enzyme I (PtsI)